MGSDQRNAIRGDAQHAHQTAPGAVLERGQVVVGPVPREPRHFQERDQVDVLVAAGATATVLAVTGPPGVGKTQVAAAYARRRVADGWLVAWLPAESVEVLTAGFLELADALGLRRHEDDAATTTRRLRDHLGTRRDPSLLVLDDVTDPADVVPRLPAGAQVVLTSSAPAVEELGTPVRVDVFTPDTATRFLRAATGLADDAGAGLLAERLGHLPLALATATARIAAAELDYGAYLRRLGELTGDGLPPARPGDPRPHGVAEAVLLAAEPFDGLARALLDVIAVLSPDGVSRELLAAHPDRDPVQLDHALERLVEAGLVDVAGTDPTVVMHHLTQRVLRGRARQARRMSNVVDDALRTLAAAAFPEEHAWRRRYLGEEIVTHTETLWAHVPRNPPAAATEELLRMRFWGVRQLIASASFDRAIQLGASLAADCRAMLGNDHHDTLRALNDLATAYRKAGRHNEAVVRHEQVLDGFLRTVGADQDSLDAATGLANAYEAAGRPERALSLYEQVLDHRRHLLGPHHLDTLSTANDLGCAYQSAGRFYEAVPLLEDTLGARRRLLGRHPHTLHTASNLALAYQAVGRVDDALRLFEQNLADTRQVLGGDNPDDNPEALRLFERNLADIRRILGDDHVDVVAAANNVASAYVAVGRIDDAGALFAETLAACRKRFGDDHPLALSMADNLAGTHRTAGRLADAVALLEQTLAGRRRRLGADHPGTLRTARALVDAYAATGRVDDAVRLAEHTVATARGTFGAEHEITLAAAAALDEVLGGSGSDS